jgi:hypothetical protein
MNNDGYDGGNEGPSQSRAIRMRKCHDDGYDGDDEGRSQSRANMSRANMLMRICRQWTAKTGQLMTPSLWKSQYRVSTSPLRQPIAPNSSSETNQQSTHRLSSPLYQHVHHGVNEE